LDASLLACFRARCMMVTMLRPHVLAYPLSNQGGSSRPWAVTALSPPGRLAMSGAWNLEDCGATQRSSRRYPSQCALAAAVGSSSLGIPKSSERKTTIVDKLRSKLKFPSAQNIRKQGSAVALSYSIVGTLNFILMVAVSWPLFIRATGGSPIMWYPPRPNPKFIVSVSAVYFSYGSVSTPFLAAAAAALAPAISWLLGRLNTRRSCPVWLALGAAALGFITSMAAIFVASVVVACRICHTPIWP